jgi:phosphate transport system protein
MREALEQSLNEITAQLLRMNSLVRGMLAESTQALIDAERDKARKALEADVEVDQLENDIESLCIRLIARHQPVASDLRFVFTVVKILTDLERAGDYAAHVAEDAALLADEPPLKRYLILSDMARRLEHMFDLVGKALAERDLEVIEELLHADREIDALYEQITRELLTYMLEDPRTISRAIALTRIARSYERIGDHLENIGERLFYWLTGKFVKVDDQISAEFS